MTEPYFVALSEQPADDDVAVSTFDATGSTVGPWDPGSMHAGPPAALLARAVERLPGGPGPGMLARLTVEILAPVPVGPVVVRARWLRQGHRVALAEALLSPVGVDRPVMRAVGWRLRTTTEPIRVPTTPTAPAPAHDGREQPLPPGWSGGYLSSVRWRWVEGEFGLPGAATVWTRLRGEVVAGEAPTGAQRVMAVADSASGISAVADIRTTVFVNTDLTVHLLRAPEGEDIWMRATTLLDAAGVGLTTSELGDRRGALAAGAQTLYVAPR